MEDYELFNLNISDSIERRKKYFRNDFSEFKVFDVEKRKNKMKMLCCNSWY